PRQPLEVAVEDAGKDVLTEERMNAESGVGQGWFRRLSGGGQTDGSDDKDAYTTHGVTLSGRGPVTSCHRARSRERIPRRMPSWKGGTVRGLANPRSARLAETDSRGRITGTG